MNHDACLVVCPCRIRLAGSVDQLKCLTRHDRRLTGSEKAGVSAAGSLLDIPSRVSDRLPGHPREKRTAYDPTGGTARFGMLRKADH